MLGMSAKTSAFGGASPAHANPVTTARSITRPSSTRASMEVIPKRADTQTSAAATYNARLSPKPQPATISHRSAATNTDGVQRIAAQREAMQSYGNNIHPVSQLREAIHNDLMSTIRSIDKDDFKQNIASNAPSSSPIGQLLETVVRLDPVRGMDRILGRVSDIQPIDYHTKKPHGNPMLSFDTANLGRLSGNLASVDGYRQAFQYTR